MANPNDSLDDLLGPKVSSASKRQARKRPPPKKGLSPAALLTLPAEQQAIVNYLSRRKRATLSEIIVDHCTFVHFFEQKSD